MRGLKPMVHVSFKYGGNGMEWLKKFNSAVDYIEKNLDKEISYDEAARTACCSSYYFQRMFSYIAGISLSEYIRRRRMTQAAFDLQQSEKKVLDIALKYGYTSPTSFNRAFHGVHGITPTAAKSTGATLNSYPALRLSVQVTGGEGMVYRMEERKAFRIVGLRIPLTVEMEENQKNVPLFWKNVLEDQRFERICSLSDKTPGEVMGITVYENPASIFYYIGVETDKEVPAGMTEYEIPAALWAVFGNDGPFRECVQNVFRRFCREWLPFSGYRYAGLPDLEVYAICGRNMAEGRSEVWIAVQSDKGV